VGAPIFDRVRYRVVVGRRDQLAPVVWYLAQHLFRFDYAALGQTQNSLMRFIDFVVSLRARSSRRASISR
jgi:uncharacterized protein (TIGR04552 family)